MEYKKEITNEFLEAMRTWDKPENMDKNKLNRIENRIKDALIKKGKIKIFQIKEGEENEDEVVALVNFGSYTEGLAISEDKEKNETKILLYYSIL